jgi:hypothetical protein
VLHAAPTLDSAKTLFKNLISVAVPKKIILAATEQAYAFIIISVSVIGVVSL